VGPLESVTATCPACDASDVHAIGQTLDLCFHRCGRCHLVFLYPQPRASVRAKYVGGFDFAAHFGPWAPRKRVLSDRRFGDLPTPVPGRDRLCDVGCADGQFLELAAARGWRIHGIELNPPAAEAARARGVSVTVGALEEIDDLPWGQFNVVTSWDVLEHTPDPRPFSAGLVRLMAPGGTLVVTTLNYDSLVRRCFGLSWSMVDEGHFTYWNARSLRALFESHGLQLVRARSFGLGRDFFAFLDRLGTRRHSTTGTGRQPNEAPAGGSHWDVNPLVLAAEAACNQLLNLTGTGVGVEASFRRP
jgi:SAM-dependent methyltransferase